VISTVALAAAGVAAIQTSPACDAVVAKRGVPATLRQRRRVVTKKKLVQAYRGQRASAPPGERTVTGNRF